MGCYKRTVYMYVDVILHDIDAELLKFSKLISSNNEMNQELQTDETRNDRPLMLRRIELFISRLEDLMQAYIVKLDKRVGDNFNKEKDEYEFILSFPENWQSRAFNRLSVEMNDYITNSCIADFLKSSYPRESSIYKDKSESCYWNIKHCITSRIPESIRKPIGWM